MVEILVVTLIILLLIGILIPVINNAKLSAKKTACLSNLHQAATALTLYVEANGDYPMGILSTNPKTPFTDNKKIRVYSPIGTYASGPTRVFWCPLDRPEGRDGLPEFDRKEPLSYLGVWFLWEGEQGVNSWKALLATDQNPVVFRCYFHETRSRNENAIDVGSFGSTWGGFAQAVRRDGSVFYDKRSTMFAASGTGGSPMLDIKKHWWTSATTTECPASICDGQEPAEGNRQR